MQMLTVSKIVSLVANLFHVNNLFELRHFMVLTILALRGV